jgi:phosphate transport system permease protein
MSNFVTFRRSVTNHVVTGVAIVSTILVLVPLVAIFGYLLYKGASSLNLAFFTKVPVPVGEPGGGMANAIVGSAVILALASLLGIPVGLAPASTWPSMREARGLERRCGLRRMC